MRKEKQLALRICNIHSKGKCSTKWASDLIDILCVIDLRKQINPSN